VTQQNAAMVEQAAARSMAFESEAHRLMAIVERFKIDADPDEAPAWRESAAPATMAKPTSHPRLPHRDAANDARGRWKR